MLESVSVVFGIAFIGLSVGLILKKLFLED